jgi:hypothetical protein
MVKKFISDVDGGNGGARGKTLHHVDWVTGWGMQAGDMAPIGELPSTQVNGGKCGPIRMVLHHVDEEIGDKLPRSVETVKKVAQETPRGVKNKMPTVRLGFKKTTTNVDGGMSGTRSKPVSNVDGVTGGRAQARDVAQSAGLSSTQVDGGKGGTENKDLPHVNGGTGDRVPRSGDHCYPKIWGKEDEIIVRKSAKSLVLKKWEILKACKNIIDDQDEVLKGMSVKEKMKEDVTWNNEDFKTYNEWKMRNVRFMSLKETSLKENRTGLFEAFCERKGLTRKKGSWETMVEKESAMKELELKEILSKKKMAKSNRKKLELYMECRKKLPLMIENWKETPDLEEERIFKKLKETAVKERIVEELGKSRNTSNANPKPNLNQNQTLTNLEDTQKKPRKTTLMNKQEMKKTGRGPGRNSPVAKKVACQQTFKQTPNVKWLAAMFSVEPVNITSARDCGQLTSKIFTKPQPVYSTSGVQASINPVTGPAHQWEERDEIEFGSRRPPGQSEQGNEQRPEQTAHIGQKRKLRDAPTNHTQDLEFL